MSPALSSRPIKGTAFFFCAAAHAAILLMLAQAGIPGTGFRRNGTATGPARDMLIPVKISPVAVYPRPDKIPAHTDSSSKKATHRQRDKSSHGANAAQSAARPQTPAVPERSAKTVTPLMPLLAKPLGQGSWGFAQSAPATRNNMMLARIQQERAALRMALMDRLSVWMGQQMQAHRNPDCLIRLSQDSRQAHLSCASGQTESILWPALSGLVFPGTPRPEDMICIAVGNGRLDFVGCDRKLDGQGSG